MAVNWKAGGGARDAGDGCFRFGNGIGEKEQRINEMAAYYLARAVVFFFFTYSAQRACYQTCVQGSYSMNPVCMHIFHAQPCKHYIVFLWFTFCTINLLSLINDYSAD